VLALSRHEISSTSRRENGLLAVGVFKEDIMTNFRILATVVLIGFLSCRCDAFTNNVVWTRLYGFTGGADGGLPNPGSFRPATGISTGQRPKAAPTTPAPCSG
jgi:hypothetical protein